MSSMILSTVRVVEAANGDRAHQSHADHEGGRGGRSAARVSHAVLLGQFARKSPKFCQRRADDACEGSSDHRAQGGHAEKHSGSTQPDESQAL